MDYAVTKDEFIVSTDKSKIDIEYVHRFLTESYWSPGVSIGTVKKGMENSLCFGIYNNDTQVGYARMITDRASFGYLADVFIDEKLRGNGLGIWFMETILAHPDLQGLRRILLATRDAHTLYEKFGFLPLNNPEKYMYYTPPQDKNK